METKKDCLRSIIAQQMYHYKIVEASRGGRNFHTYAYIPEVDQITGLPFHEREDHNHVLKVITLQHSGCYLIFSSGFMK